MKKSQAIQLILITAALASCNRPGFFALHSNYPPDDIYGEDIDRVPFVWNYSFRSYAHFAHVPRHHAYWSYHASHHRRPFTYRPRPRGLARHTIAHGGFGHTGHIAHGGFGHS